ncbi:MAG: class I SAM-dependent methyltransferase [Hyphomicrobiaceae bacterium]
MDSKPDDLKARVRSFWEQAPLFTGETAAEAGTLDYFRAHEAVYLSDVFPKGDIPKRFFPFSGGASVLDVGCGPGFWTRSLARRGYRTSAVDLTQKAVDLTRRSLDLFDLDAEVRVGDAEALPFPSGTFDGVVSHGVIHHTPNTQTCVNEIARVLKPGGIAVVSVYYKNLVLRSPALTRATATVLSRVVSLPGRGREKLLSSGDADEIVRLYDGSDNPLGKSYRRDQFEAMFVKAGLVVEMRWRWYFPLRSFGRLGKALLPAHRFTSDNFGLMIAVRASKPTQRNATQ